jgi:hypothetical protein
MVCLNLPLSLGLDYDGKVTGWLLRWKLWCSSAKALLSVIPHVHEVNQTKIARPVPHVPLFIFEPSPLTRPTALGFPLHATLHFLRLASSPPNSRIAF